MDCNMDPFTPIPLHVEWKISEAELKSLSENTEMFLYDDKKKIGCSGVDYEVTIGFDNENGVDENDIQKYTVNGYLTFRNMKNGIDFRVKYAFYIKSANFATEYTDCIYTFNEDRTYDAICLVEDLFNPEKNFISNGELVIEIKGMVYVELPSDTEFVESLSSLAQLLWKSDDDRDFNIVVVKEHETKTTIKVHKCVLAAYSSVFRAMFKTDMKEKEESKVEIIDFNAQTVQSAVAFCYEQSISEVNKNVTSACDLYTFADKYNMEDLKNTCERALMKIMTPQNACEIANVATITSSTKLQEFCYRSMLMFIRQAIPVENFDTLDKTFANDLFQKAFSAEYS